MKPIVLLKDFKEDYRFSMDIYAESLSKALQEYDSDAFEIHDFTPKMPAFLQNKWGMRFARYILYPLQIPRKTTTLYHIIDHGYGHLIFLLNPNKTVITVHDLIPVVRWKNGIPHVPSKRIPLLALFSLQGIKRAKRVITDSECTTRDIVHYIGCDPEKIKVVYPGIDPMFQPYSSEEKTLAKARWFGDDPHGQYVLIMGDQFYKNPETVLETIQLLNQQGHKSIRIVKTREPDNYWNSLINKYGGKDLVIHVGDVSREKIPDLINAVDLLFFPSLYEGFGWPPLEAMACGIPVVSSNAGSLPEVIGNVGIMHDPKDVTGFAHEIDRILNDTEYRDLLIAQGFKQASKFTWQSAASEIVEIYKEMS